MTLCRRAILGLLTLGDEAQQVLVAKADQLPARMQLRGEVEHLFIEKRITHLHGGMHSHAITLRLQQVPSQRDSCTDPQTPIQRTPALRTLQIHA